MSDEQNNAKAPAGDRIARILMVILGIASLGAFANATQEFSSFGPERVSVEAWRMFAFPVFAGLFILLGAFPRRMTGIWELVFYHKAATAIFMAYFVQGAAAQSITDQGIIVVDTVLAAVTFFCYLLTQGWRAWLR